MIKRNVPDKIDERDARRLAEPAPTMQDVAKAAGVSLATVSAALNGTAKVSPQRLQRVEQAVARIGYQRNSIARSLKLGRTGTIGLTVPDIRNPFFTDVVSTVQRVLNEAGYAVMLCCNDENTARQDEHIKLLLDRRVDGLIIAPAGDDAIMEQIIVQARKPVVLIDRLCEGLEADAVVIDNREAVLEATRYLLRLGHRRIGYVSGSANTYTGRQRLAGYQQALAEADSSFDPELIREGRFRQEDGYRAVMELLSLAERPTAVFSANNLMAIGAMKAIGDRGMCCPNDISVACFDDFPWADAFSPQLTTIAQPVQAIGQHAARLLLERLRGQARGSEPRQLTLRGRLMIRSSCRPIQ